MVPKKQSSTVVQNPWCDMYRLHAMRSYNVIHIHVLPFHLRLKIFVCCVRYHCTIGSFSDQLPIFQCCKYTTKIGSTTGEATVLYWCTAHMLIAWKINIPVNFSPNSEGFNEGFSRGLLFMSYSFILDTNSESRPFCIHSSTFALLVAQVKFSYYIIE